MLGIPKEIDLSNLKKDLDKCYSYFYIAKPQKRKVKETKEDRIKRYLSLDEPIDIFDTRPEDYSKDKYRMLININENWLKKALKKINKMLSTSLITKENKNINYPIPYLHSSLKKRSYTTNAEFHKDNKYLLAIDIQNFYPSVSYEKIINFFRYELNLEKDIAEIYTALCTCPIDDPIVNPKKYGIGQGLATSPVLAYLSNYRMFDYIYELAQKENIEMTVYVDDVIFSSDKEISQNFINKLFGIVKSNGLKIKKSKVKIYGPKQNKKITGLCITTGGKVKVPNSKHEEIKYQYLHLTRKLLEINNMTDYFDFYNLFLKFKGNVQFVNLVEGNVSSKYTNFVNNYNKYFLNGIRKIKKVCKYSKNNISCEDYEKFVKKYEDLRKIVDSSIEKVNATLNN
jgi:hypothetical protein